VQILGLVPTPINTVEMLQLESWNWPTGTKTISTDKCWNNHKNCNSVQKNAGWLANNRFRSCWALLKWISVRQWNG